MRQADYLTSSKHMLRHRTMSVAEALAEAGDPARHDAGDVSRDPMHDPWAGASWEDAADMAVTGYRAGAERLRKHAGLIARVRTARRPGPVWGPAGSSVDVGRYLASEPDCMVDVVRKARPSPVLKLNVERCVSFDVPPSDIEATGAGVLAAVELLRTAGVPCEVWTSFVQTTYDRDQHRTYALSVLVQEAGKPIDVDRLAFWVVHPAALRRIAFAVEECESWKDRNTWRFVPHGSYSSPCTLRAAGAVEAFDEHAPARQADVVPWMVDVLTRRAGITIAPDDLPEGPEWK